MPSIPTMPEIAVVGLALGMMMIGIMALRRSRGR